MIEAVQANFYPTNSLNVGASVMRWNSNTSDFREFANVMVDYNLNDYVQFFGEYAFETKDALSFDSDKDAFAIYGGSNFYYGSFGGIFEVKSYNNFRLGETGGTGFNDPPSLIKEHTYPVLNRSTHVVDTGNETGLQAEVYYNFEEGHSIVLNYTRAVNDGFVRFEYTEYFVEGLYQLNDNLTLKAFFDYANDENKGEEDRISIGFIPESIFPNSSSLILDLQYQQFSREEFDLTAGEFIPQTSRNFYASISFSLSSELVFSGVLEASTDPQLTDNPRTFTIIEEDTRYWLGGNALFRANPSNTIEMFAGKRRGGPACTSGICYEILDFEGVELRLTTRF